MKFESLEIPGCYLIYTDRKSDHRGSFTKTFNKTFFQDSPLRKDLEFKEDFYSISKPGTLRGLHFQMPPSAHDKLVFCLQGEILDVGLDLRKGSRTFGRHFKISLRADDGKILFLPLGIAHGFYVPRNSLEALTYYKVTTEYDAKADSGVLWNSAGIDWPDADPIISERDQKLQELASLGSGIQFTS